MFAVKVENGKERIRVRHYASGFLPSFRPYGSVTKRLIVPGYVFMLSFTTGAEKVPDGEWALIEAISDSHPSTFDPETETITDGPLAVCNGMINRVDREKKAVQIRVQLMGEKRDYWLEVTGADSGKEPTDSQEPAEDGDKPAEAQEKPAENGTETAISEPTIKEEKIMDEQTSKAIERAKEIGLHAAAKEAGIPWQSLRSAARKAGIEITPKTSRKKADKPAEDKEKKPAGQKGKKGKKAARSAAEDKAETAPAGEKAVTEEEMTEDALSVENAVLRERIAKLEAQVAKLKKALQELL